MRYKHGSLDKFDCYFPSHKPPVHDNWCVSKNHENLHVSQGFMHYDTNRRGHRFGINRKAYKVSGAGIAVDGSFIGKPEAL